MLSVLFDTDYAQLDKQLDSLDTVLTVLEEKGDHLHEEVKKFLEEAKQVRREQELSQQTSDKDSNTKE